MPSFSLAEVAAQAEMQIVSQAEASGEVAVQELADIQGQTFDSPRVLVSNQIGGMEDIPVSFPYLSLEPTLFIASYVYVPILELGTHFVHFIVFVCHHT